MRCGPWRRAEFDHSLPAPLDIRGIPCLEATASSLMSASAGPNVCRTAPASASVKVRRGCLLFVSKLACCLLSDFAADQEILRSGGSSAPAHVILSRARRGRFPVTQRASFRLQPELARGDVHVVIRR